MNLLGVVVRVGNVKHFHITIVLSRSQGLVYISMRLVHLSVVVIVVLNLVSGRFVLLFAFLRSNRLFFNGIKLIIGHSISAGNET